MIQIYKTIEERLTCIDQFEKGCWVNITYPDEKDLHIIHNELGIDMEFLKAALDEEERARIEYEDDCTLVIVDIPIISQGINSNSYITLPLGIIFKKGYMITVCLKENSIIKDFEEDKVKSFYTFKQIRFIFQIFYKISSYYLQYLKQINKASDQIERELHKSMKNKELIQLLELEKSLVYFSTSLKANEIVMERMLKMESIKQYPDDADLLEDVIIENKQAIEMTTIYSNILSGMMDAFASVISNNLNIVMKILTSITIVMAIPTMIASFFGMNVPLPLQNYPHAFTLIFGISCFLSVISVIIMVKRQLF